MAVIHVITKCILDLPNNSCNLYNGITLPKGLKSSQNKAESTKKEKKENKKRAGGGGDSCKATEMDQAIGKMSKL